jgi:hypothetical protein
VEWGIFNMSVALNAEDEPSGEVPGVDDGGCGSRSCMRNVGEEDGSDCFFQFLDRVYVVKFEDQFAISASSRVLL